MRTLPCHWFAQVVVCALLAAPAVSNAQAQPAPSAKPATPAPAPARARTVKPAPVAQDLVVELRERTAAHDTQDTADEPAAYSVSTQPADGGVTPQLVRVQSGEKAMLRVVQSTPMQWMQSGQQGSATLNADTASATQNSSAVTQATTLIEAGHTLVVTPHWAGASRPVRVELLWQSDSVAERTGAELPATARRQFSTTVRVPLQQWVTIATRGANPTAGSYSSAGATEPRRALQLRVSLP